MQDMASLLAEESMKEFNPHEVIEGTVVLVNRDEAYVDIGYKTEIPIAKKELAYPEPEAATDVVKVGDKINVYVVALGGENGLILSKTRADRLVAWEKVEKVKEEKQIIDSSGCKRWFTHYCFWSSWIYSCFSDCTSFCQRFK